MYLIMLLVGGVVYYLREIAVTCKRLAVVVDDIDTRLTVVETVHKVKNGGGL